MRHDFSAIPVKFGPCNTSLPHRKNSYFEPRLDLNMITYGTTKPAGGGHLLLLRSRVALLVSTLTRTCGCCSGAQAVKPGTPRKSRPGAIISGLRRDVPSSYLDIEHTFCQRHCVAANSALGHIRQSREEAVNGTPVEGYV